MARADVLVRFPFTVIGEFIVIPPVLLLVKLLRTVELEGISVFAVIAVFPVYVTFTVVPNVGAADKLPTAVDVRLITTLAPLPNIKALVPLSNCPSVSVSVPLTVTAPARFVPAVLLIDRLFKETVGIVIRPAPAVATIKFDDEPPVNIPLPKDVVPLIVKLFDPIASVPVVSCNEVFTTTLPTNATV